MYRSINTTLNLFQVRMSITSVTQLMNISFTFSYELGVITQLYKAFYKYKTENYRRKADNVDRKKKHA